MIAKSIQRARKLRASHTDAENILWQKIRARQLTHKFRRQIPIGCYVVDFACLELKLVIEVDGAQHADSKSDKFRKKYLEGLGFKIIRFWNNDVLNNTEGVYSTLTLTLSQRERELREVF